jgi:hypothetical protein
MAVMTVKQAATSKINYVALALLVLGFVTDPQFINLIPETWGPLILKISGPLLFVLRTFLSKPVEPTTPLVTG